MGYHAKRGRNPQVAEKGRHHVGVAPHASGRFRRSVMWYEGDRMGYLSTREKAERAITDIRGILGRACGTEMGIRSGRGSETVTLT
jgi:hypothetical protein